MPQQFGPTASDVLDDVVDDLEAIAAIHDGEAAKLTRMQAVSAALAQQEAAKALRNRAKHWAERARLIRAHDEATTRKTQNPSLASRRSWLWRILRR